MISGILQVAGKIGWICRRITADYFPSHWACWWFVGTV